MEAQLYTLFCADHPLVSCDLPQLECICTRLNGRGETPAQRTDAAFMVVSLVLGQSVTCNGVIWTAEAIK